MQWSDDVHWRNKYNIRILKEMVELTVSDMNHSLLFPVHKRTELSWTFEPPCQIKVTAFSLQKKQILIWQFEQAALCVVDLSAERFLPFLLVSWSICHLSCNIKFEKLLLIQDGAWDALPVWTVWANWGTFKITLSNILLLCNPQLSYSNFKLDVVQREVK